MKGRGWAHQAQVISPPLSLKFMRNCRAHYRVGRREMLVDPHHFLILNHGTDYDVDIDASGQREQAESWIMFFPEGAAESVGRAMDSRDVELLDEPNRTEERYRFSERVRMGEAGLTSLVRNMADDAGSGAKQIGGLGNEARLLAILHRMHQIEREDFRVHERIDAQRPGTRTELWRRLSLGRDWLQAHSTEEVTLVDAAKAASMSVFHFQRRFTDVFGESPHAWRSRCRLRHAQHLLTHSDRKVLDVCIEVGFSSLSSFGLWFRRLTGVSPGRWRRVHGHRTHIRNFR